MLKLYSTSLRNGLKEILNSVNEELVSTSPYIKPSKAEWVCDELERGWGGLAPRRARRRLRLDSVGVTE